MSKFYVFIGKGYDTEARFGMDNYIGGYALPGTAIDVANKALARDMTGLCGAQIAVIDPDDGELRAVYCRVTRNRWWGTWRMRGEKFNALTALLPPAVSLPF